MINSEYSGGKVTPFSFLAGGIMFPIGEYLFHQQQKHSTGNIFSPFLHTVSLLFEINVLPLQQKPITR